MLLSEATGRKTKITKYIIKWLCDACGEGHHRGLHINGFPIIPCEECHTVQGLIREYHCVNTSFYS